MLLCVGAGFGIFCHSERNREIQLLNDEIGQRKNVKSKERKIRISGFQHSSFPSA